MRIALATEGTRGDVYPLLALAERLCARGHEAVLCASPDFEAAAIERGVEFQRIGHSVNGIMQRYSAEVSQGGVRLLSAIREYAGVMIRRQFEQLPEATRGADLVIGAGVQVAAPSRSRKSRRSLPVRGLLPRDNSIGRIPPRCFSRHCGPRAGSTARCGGR